MNKRLNGTLETKNVEKRFSIYRSNGTGTPFSMKLKRFMDKKLLISRKVESQNNKKRAKWKTKTTNCQRVP